MIATSTRCSAKYASAIAVVASKNVAPSRVIAGSHASSHAVTDARGIGTPFTTTRSQKSTRCGEV